MLAIERGIKMNNASAHHHWQYGLDDPALGSQQTFRAILRAMEHPGQIVTVRHDPIAPQEFYSATAAACLTLLDCETPVWTDIDWESPAISWLLFGCDSNVVTEPCMADFVLVTEPAGMPDLSFFKIARCDDTEKATTLIVQVDDILPGPGYDSSNFPIGKSPRLELKGIPDNFWEQWRQLSVLYPCGLDVFFTCEDVLTALPKTVPFEN